MRKLIVSDILFTWNEKINFCCRIGFHSDALEVAYLALDSHPNFVVNHFTVGNIHTTMVSI